MATRSSEFEFLLTAPRRFDGGPEVEWIQWLEEQSMNQHYQSHSRSEKALQAELKFSELEKERQLRRSQAILSSQAQQVQHHAASIQETNKPAATPADKQLLKHKALDEISLMRLMLSPFYHLVLASCGLFVSTVMFQLVFGKEAKKTGKYKVHNDMVYQQSITVFKASIKSIVKLPVRMMKKIFKK